MASGCSSANGSAISGFLENSRTHGCAFANGAGGTSFAASRFENNPYPRSLSSRLKVYNADYNISVNGTAT